MPRWAWFALGWFIVCAAIAIFVGWRWPKDEQDLDDDWP
jgi:hypothetical protein